MIAYFNIIVFKLKVQKLMVEALGIPKFAFLLSWLIREYTLKEKKVWRHKFTHIQKLMRCYSLNDYDRV